MKAHLRHVSLTVVAAIAFAIAVPATSDCAYFPNPGGQPPGSDYYGKSYGDWAAMWWQWAVSIRADRNPMRDTTGEFAGEGQGGDVWFLAGSWYREDTVTRSCTIPAGKALFFPVRNVAWITMPWDTGGEDLVEWFYANEGWIRELVKWVTDNITDVSCEIDREPLENLDKYRAESPVFMVNVPEDNVYDDPEAEPPVDLPEGQYGPAVGWFSAWALRATCRRGVAAFLWQSWRPAFAGAGDGLFRPFRARPIVGTASPRAADAIWARYLVNHDARLAIDLLPDLVMNYEEWEKSRLDPNGLFWQIDDRDGMEYSIGGSGYRPTINSYMCGDAAAIADIAELAGQQELARAYRAKAAKIKHLVQSRLWDKGARFFKTLPRGENSRLVDVREEIGFVPWYFNLPDAGYEAAWSQIMDPAGFYAPFGPTTAERRHPRFMFEHSHDCLWNGPSWPYATTQTLVGMANVLNNYDQQVIDKKDYMAIFGNYARSQYKNGKPWIAEDLNGITGQWIVDKPRSADYNHSGFCDLVITGVIGLRPRPDGLVEVNPLVPDGTWEYFCLDGVWYHDHVITVFYDSTGKRYNRGAGLHLFADGREIAASDQLSRRIVAKLPSDVQDSKPEAGQGKTEPTAKAVGSPDTSSGWVKSEHDPVLGGELGTCFDVSVLKEGQTFRMWFSWRPKRSIALVESNDGVHWSNAAIVLGPNRATGWEEDVNRPVVVKRPAAYHMWYTGQAKGHSWIGCATSKDGISWTRMSEKPVLSPELPWEKVAVMCPHVLWDEKAGQYRMWYSAGEQYEPDAIGYATSPDGLKWTKSNANPIFRADPANPWERHKVTACQVVPHGGWHIMFYIGFRDVDHAQIGLARSRDGMTEWRRHPGNPIIRPSANQWDHDAVYKPYAILDGERWLLWYNGRRGSVEQIGLAIHEGEDLGF